MRILYFLAAMVLTSLVSTASVINVPADYPTLQQAIDAAQKGDTVLAAPGTYVETIDFKGKAVAVKSDQGPGVTVIDGNQADCVVCFQGGEGNDSMLQGFTVTNGVGRHIGGAYHGGGIYCTGASPTLEGNIIMGCTAQDGNGGGIFCDNGSHPVIEHNLIYGNAASISGGGIYWYNAEPEVRGNDIYLNLMGGGIYCAYTTSEIRGNMIRGNTGGGVSCYYASPEIRDNLILGNIGVFGGGIYCDKSSPQIVNNAVCANTSQFDGGGIKCWMHSSPTITNNTIVRNHATSGGGISCLQNSNPVVSNTILWNNEVQYEGKEIYIGHTTFPCTLTIRYSDVELGKASVLIDAGSTLNWEAGMIDADPIFVDAPNNDYHLTRLSTCINMGDDSSSPAGDHEGDQRPCMGTVDIGFDEFIASHLLEADLFTLSAATGGKVNLALRAGAENSGRIYFMLGSLTGTAPGLPLPGGKATLPINMDLFTSIIWQNLNTPFFQNFLGILDISGQGTAVLDTLAPLPASVVGVTMSYAYALYNPLDFASHPINVLIEP